MEVADPPFCCQGCALAYRIIQEAGLGRYYTQRTDYPPRPAAPSGAWDGVPTRVRDDGGREARLAIDGLRCASCVWLVEHAVAALPGVESTHVSYGSGRATVQWDPEAVALQDIAERISRLGYRPRVLGEERKPDRSLLMRLGLAVFGALNIMMIHAAIYAGWAGMDARFTALFQWAALVLATPVALWSGAPFLRGAWEGVRQGRLHMDLPIAISVGGLYLHGVLATAMDQETYLDSMAMLVALLLAGRVLEGRGRRRAAEAAVTLGASVPPRARRRRGGRVEDVPVDALERGDHIEVAAGEEIPADGEVVSGTAVADLSMMTGETDGAPLRKGTVVVGGAVLMEGAVTVRVSATGAESLVARMAKDIREAVDQPVESDGLERVAPWFTALTLLAGAGTFAAWARVGGWAAALPVTVSVLVVACPCALALARPLALSAGLGVLARRGLLLRSGDSLMGLASVDVAVLDKTGTVTVGERRVVSGKDDVVRVAAGLARWSAHPASRAVVREAERRGIPLPGSSQVQEHVGMGLEGEVDGERWRLTGGGRGGMEVARVGSDEPAGRIELDDCVRATSRRAVEDLSGLGLEVMLVSGDAERPVEAVAGALGIDKRAWGATPEEKVARVRSLRERGRGVLFVGDGLNDGPALATADVGLSMRRGAASSLLVADGVLVHDSTEALVAAVRTGRAAKRLVATIQRRSIAYNVIAVTAAMAGWVNPLIAAILMPLSSFMVVVGASRVGSAAKEAP
ncbi:MAG: heavy metal translocating P-type ATPase [Gemmatimonadetes bacterium]|nr:heavy metal translocating P-type ATPase [Gemmatimonadota bacterium]